MKNKKMSKYILSIAVIVLILSMSACAVDPSYDGSDMDTITVEMNVDFPDPEASDDTNSTDNEEAETEGVQTDFVYPDDLESCRMQVENGATVMQILESFASQNDLDIQVETADGNIRVTSIGDIVENDSGSWEYKINGKSIMEEASKYVPKNGDKITWVYIKF